MAYGSVNVPGVSLAELQEVRNLAASANEAAVITDWDSVNAPGMYYSAKDAANAPSFSSGNYGIYGIAWRYGKQVKVVATQQMGTEFFVRFCESYDDSTWYPWMKLGAADSALNSTSENPIQNRAVYLALAGKADTEPAVGTRTSVSSANSGKYRKIAAFTCNASEENVYARVDYDAAATFSMLNSVASGSVVFGFGGVKITNTDGAVSKEFAIAVNGNTIDLYVLVSQSTGRLYQFRKGPCFCYALDGVTDLRGSLTFEDNIASSAGDVDLSGGTVLGDIYYSQTV